MAFMFGGGQQPQAQQQPAVAGLQLQTSAFGKVVPIVYGTTRLAPNLIWYGDFTATAHESAPPHAGKGGSGGGGKGGGGSVTYTYTAAVALGLCEGPIAGIGRVWASKQQTSLAALNLTLFTGTYPQAPWTYLGAPHDTGVQVEVAETQTVPIAAPFQVTVAQAAGFAADGGVTYKVVNEVVGIAWTPLRRVSAAPGPFEYAVADGVYTFSPANGGLLVSIDYAYRVVVPGAHPDQALGYSGLAYVAAAPYDLGESAQLPNHGFEVQAAFGDAAAGRPDADPSLVVRDLLTNPHYGAGFPAARLGDLSAYQAYCLATGLLVSPAYTEARQASDILTELAAFTNSELVWSSGQLTLVPRGDAPVSGNGRTYTPPAAPLYSLTDDDFVRESGADPVQLVRKRPADALNAVKIEFLNRASQYSPEVVEAKDQAAIDVFGLRADAARQAHLFADAGAARQSAQLLLQRQAIRNLYTFRLDWRYPLLDPMDIVAISDAALGLDRQWVRITEITEDEDGTLAVTAEEYLNGSGAAALYAFQQGAGYAADYNAAPGDMNAPIIFEPPDALAGGLEMWLAVSGGAAWGGCDVYLSNDGQSYRLLDRVRAPARMGVLAAPLPAVAAAATGPTIDAAGTLAVDLSESRGTLLSGTRQDALNLNTLCWADGELVAYHTADLTAASRYDLSYLVRGAYGTTPRAHAAGTPFVRLDGGILRVPFTQDRVGQTAYFKFLSFNLWGGGRQGLGEVQPYAHTIQGAALASPLPDVQNLTSSLVAGLTQLTWDAVRDFRLVDYEIRKGADWAGAQILGRTPNTLFPAQGDGTYWVAAHANPIRGLEVYSATPASVVLAGSVLTRNVIARHDEQATGWSGTLGGAAVVVAGAVVTGGAGNILAGADFLGAPDILFYGGADVGGTYQIPSGHRIDIGRVAPCNVIINWTSIGQVLGADLLTQTDILGMTDVLGNAASVNTSVYPEIRLAQGDGVYGPWRKYVPGAYAAQHYDARMQIQSSDGQTQAALTSFVFAVDVPDRLDSYVGESIPAAGLALVYRPGGAASPAPFNGGPNGAALPNVQVTIVGASAGDDAIVSGQTLAGCTIRVVNGGVGVERHCNIFVQGY